MNPFRHFARTPWMGDEPIASPLLLRTTQHRKKLTYSHASRGIPTHDPNFRVVQDGTCLRPRSVVNHTLGKAMSLLRAFLVVNRASYCHILSAFRTCFNSIRMEPWLNCINKAWDCGNYMVTVMNFHIQWKERKFSEGLEVFITLYACILEVLGSSLSRLTTYPDDFYGISQSFHEIPGLCP
jgi:hypothetical protein